ncbi:hypothetical protein PQS90_09080 [Pseudomonas sp. BLCC-B13]|nr:hypothetical protein [Pseudomonas sp. BLCC-B13]
MAHYTVWAIWWLFWGGAAVWLLVGSVAYWVQKGWMPADSAGWAQALGSFVAIIVALALPYFQARKQSSDREDDELRKRLEAINAAYALISHFHGLFKRLAVYDTTWPIDQLFRVKNPLGHELVQAAAMLREIPVTALSNELVHFMVGLREVANYGEYSGLQLDKLAPGHREFVTIQSQSLANVELLQRWMDELFSLESYVREPRQ